jgi:hypothetical protein
MRGSVTVVGDSFVNFTGEAIGHVSREPKGILQVEVELELLIRRREIRHRREDRHLVSEVPSGVARERIRDDAQSFDLLGTGSEAGSTLDERIDPRRAGEAELGSDAPKNGDLFGRDLPVRHDGKAGNLEDSLSILPPDALRRGRDATNHLGGESHEEEP